jgi:hypothetical protein
VELPGREHSATSAARSTFTHFDIKSLRALKVLVLKPGERTRAYVLFFITLKTMH